MTYKVALGNGKYCYTPNCSKHASQIEEAIDARYEEFMSALGYETTRQTLPVTPADQQHAVLVYGSLRPGLGNYQRYLTGETTGEETVRIQGFNMHSFGAFPFLVDSDYGAGEIVATYVTVNTRNYDKVMRDLDRLEGFHGEGDATNSYDRRLVTFTHNDREHKAWIYIAAPDVAAAARMLPLVESGDWYDFDSPEKI